MIAIAIGSKTHAMNKVYPDAAAALHDVFDGAVILAGGFGLSGNPENCIRELAQAQHEEPDDRLEQLRDDRKGLGVLLAQGQVKKMIASYVGENKIFEQQFLSGQLEVELCPQGTLAERLRAGGAGIEAFYTPTGVRHEDRRGQGDARARRASTACSSARSAATSRS